MVLDSGESLLAIINEILDFSKIEAGKIELEHTTFPLRDCLGDAMKSLAVRAHNKGLELACHVPADVPDSLVRRSQPPAASHRQSAGQCAQVHRAGRNRARRLVRKPHRR